MWWLIGLTLILVVLPPIVRRKRRTDALQNYRHTKKTILAPITLLLYMLRAVIVHGRPLQAVLYQIAYALAIITRGNGTAYATVANLHILALVRWDMTKRLFADTNNIDKGFGYHFLHGWLGKGLLTGSGLHWRNFRRAFNPLFRRPMLAVHSATIVKEANALSNSLCRQPKAVDVRDVASEWSLRVLGKTILGVDLDEISQDARQAYLEAVHNLTRLAIARALNPLLWSDFIYGLTPQGRQAAKLLQQVLHMTDSVIRQRTAQSDATASAAVVAEPSTLLDVLISAHRQDPKAVTIQDIRDQVNTFIFAGHDTSATALSFALYIVGQMPDVQERIFDEVTSAIADCHSLGTNCLLKLKYTEAVIKECLRMYPPVPFIARTISEQIDLDRGNVPPGTSVFICIFALHSDPKLFPEPFAFRPERFLDDGPHTGYVPFSTGPRGCIGQRFAIQELVLTLASIVLNCRLESTGQLDQLILSIEVVIRSKTPLEVKFTARGTESTPAHAVNSRT